MNTHQTFQIPASDGFLLSANLFTPEGEIKGVVQLNSAAGVAKDFYIKFNQYLVAHGFVVLSYDYRGIGGSRPEKLSNFEAYSREWGEKDMTGIQNWLIENYPDYPKFVMGHSIGAVLVGLMPNHRHLKGIVMVAPPSGYWKLHPIPFRYGRLFSWYVIIPLMIRLFGYAPLKRLGVMEDIPRGVMQEWADWCTHPNYLGGFIGKTIKNPYFEEVKAPIMSYELSDDNIATPSSVPLVLNFYKNASINRELIQPLDIGAKEIGHFGFFRSRFSESLWAKPVKWLEELL